MALRDIAAGLPLRLIGLMVLGHAAFTGNRFTLALQAVALKASAFEIGLLMGLVMVLPMFLAVRAGRWCDRFGYVRPAALGLAMLAASGPMAGLAGSMTGLCVAGVLTGSGFMLAFIAVNNAIGQACDPARLTHAFSILTMGFSLSGVLGPLVAGVVIDHFGHAAAFLVLTAFPLAALALLGVARRHHLAPPREVRAAPGRVADLVLREPMRSVYIVSAVLSMGWDLFMFLAPLHGAHAGLSATATSLVVAAYGIGTFAIRGILPLLAANVSMWRTLSLSMFVTAACYVVFPLASTLPLLLPAALAMGLALGCGQPVAMSLLYLTAPKSRSGEAAGVRSTITSTSQTVLPLVFGAVGTALGVLAVFWIGAVILAAGGVFARRRG